LALASGYRVHPEGGEIDMKIIGVETMVVRMQRRRAHVTAVATAKPAESTHVIAKVKTDEGIVGLGEAPVMVEWGGDHMKYFGESPQTVTHMINDYLIPRMVGEDPFNIESIHTLMDRCVKGHPYAKATIDMALYDIKGKALGVPVYQLLGGCYRREVPLCHSIGIMLTEKAVEEAAETVQDGIKTIKLKVGYDPGGDVERVRRVREAVGDEVNLVIDANQGYATPKLAIRVIKELEKYNLLYAEQPVEGLAAMAEVAAAVDTPIMADESAWTAQDILQIAQMKAADVISLYVTKPGGLFRAKQVAAVAETAGLACNVNGSAEFGVANAANVHLMASTKVVTHAGVFPVTTVKGKEQTRLATMHYLDDIVKEPFKFKEGCLIVPDGPGLGVDLDEEKVDKYRID
jgi:muconate cycloisomerase